MHSLQNKALQILSVNSSSSQSNSSLLDDHNEQIKKSQSKKKIQQDYHESEDLKQINQSFQPPKNTLKKKHKSSKNDLRYQQQQYQHSKQSNSQNKLQQKNICNTSSTSHEITQDDSLAKRQHRFAKQNKNSNSRSNSKNNQINNSYTFFSNLSKGKDSCQRQKFEMKQRITELQSKINLQKKKIKKMAKQLQNECDKKAINILNNNLNKTEDLVAYSSTNSQQPKIQQNKPYLQQDEVPYNKLHHHHHQKHSPKKKQDLQNQLESQEQQLHITNQTATLQQYQSQQQFQNQQQQFPYEDHQQSMQIDNQINNQQTTVHPQYNSQNNSAKINVESSERSAIEEYELKIRLLKENELKLMQELNEQQKITREALSKLYKGQEEQIIERENTRRTIEDGIQRRHQEALERYEKKIIQLEAFNEDLLIQIKQLNSLRSNSEQGSYFQLENNKLKNEIAALRQEIRDKSNVSEIEMQTLKKHIDSLQKTNEYLRSQREQSNQKSKESNQNNEHLLEQIVDLKQQLSEKEQEIQEKEEHFKQQLDKISTKIVDWQEDLGKMRDLEQESESLKENIKILKQKIVQKSNKHKQDKLKWRQIYNDLVDQIKSLKHEIDQISLENKQVLSNLNALAPLY